MALVMIPSEPAYEVERMDCEYYEPTKRLGSPHPCPHIARRMADLMKLNHSHEEDWKSNLPMVTITVESN